MAIAFSWRVSTRLNLNGELAWHKSKLKTLELVIDQDPMPVRISNGAVMAKVERTLFSIIIAPALKTSLIDSIADKLRRHARNWNLLNRGGSR